MTDVKSRDWEAKQSLLFLRDEELREAMELLYFAYRDFTAEADEILSGFELGRAHHRALHFIAGHPNLTIMELLGLLRITKQSLGRVLKDLIDAELVLRTQGESDRRFKHLSLTTDGKALEGRLTGALKRAIAKAYRSAGSEAVQGFRQVLTGLLNDETRALIETMAEKHK